MLRQAQEKRRQERYAFERQPEGKLYLTTGDLRQRVGINDMSSSGVSLFLDHEITVPSRVRVEYSDSKMRVEAYGTATWCRPRNSEETGESPIAVAGNFNVGIELVSPMLLLSMFQKY